MKRIFGSPTKRELLKAAFPNERAFLAFEAQMKRETDLYKNAQFVSPRTGSQTAPREADAGDFGAMASDMAGALMTGVLVPGQTVRGAIGQQFRNMGARAQGISPGVADVLASQMFTSDPRVIAQTGGLLSQADINNALAALQARRLGGALLPSPHDDGGEAKPGQTKPQCKALIRHVHSLLLVHHGGQQQQHPA